MRTASWKSRRRLVRLMPADGRPYYKVENTTTLMPRQLFERLIRENHPEKFSWEKEICHKAILEDLDAKRISGTIHQSRPLPHRHQR